MSPSDSFYTILGYILAQLYHLEPKPTPKQILINIYQPVEKVCQVQTFSTG